MKSERLTGYGKSYTNFYGLSERLSARKAWHMGHMRGEPVSSGWGFSLGSLPSYWRNEFMREADHIDYVVWSYNTAIAWHGPKGWIEPDVKYSRTTTRHQGRIRVAISVM